MHTIDAQYLLFQNLFNECEIWILLKYLLQIRSAHILVEHPFPFQPTELYLQSLPD